jgi:hypothetical protein
MTQPLSEEKTPPIIYLIIILLPFLLFYWMVPFIADKSIGVDYQTTALENQMELLFSIKTGSFPLFVPGFASDHSSSALTLGEVYHPLPHIASILPGYWSGNALQLNTLLRLFSLGLTHLVLFYFLRRLKLNILFSFLLSCITVYNLRMLDMFRYGSSLESYTGHLLLCSAIGLYFINPTKFLGPLSIIGATYLLICSGHPQMMYYGLLGAGLFLIVAPFFISAILPEKQADLKAAFKFWGRAGIFLGIGILLSLAYILPFYFDFISTNVERVGQTYRWADSIKDTFIGTLNNFYLPFRSEVHGAFGGSSVIIMAALLPTLKCFKVKIPRPIWVVWGLILFTFLYMQGSRTPVHQVVWEYLPFASSFRHAGRISLIMPILIMMMLAWTVNAGSFSIRLGGKDITVTPAILLTLTAFALMTLYYLLIVLSFIFQLSIMLEFAPFTPVSIRKIPRSVEILVILSGMVSLLALALYYSYPRATKALGILLCTVTLIQTGTVLKYGTWIADRHDTPTFKQMLAQKKEKLDYRFYPGTGMFSSIVTTQLKNSFKEPFIGKIYYDAVSVSNLDESYDKMSQGRIPQQVFIESYEQGNSLPTTLQDKDTGNTMVKLIYSSFNRLQFRVVSSMPAFFGLSYPYTGHWKAWLNERKTPVYRANASAHAIVIPKGESMIEFRYWSPASFWGMIISCAAFAIIGLYFSCQSLTGLVRILSVFLVLAFSTGGFMLWQHSLYRGASLGTAYTWTYKPPSPTTNLAYGKKTWVSLSFRGSPGYLHSSLGIDGDISPESGFATRMHNNPAWTVDLHSIEKIKSIVLYESFNEPLVNIRPLNISVSIDGEQWHIAGSVTSPVSQRGFSSVHFKRAETAQFIKIQASGRCSLRFDEVEVYGPENQTR